MLREVFLRDLRFSPLLKNQHLICFDLFDLQSPQLVQHSCSARMIWDSNKVIIIIIIIITKADQGLRLTFQLASPVASDRFDSLAKTNISLVRYSNVHHHIKSSN